MNADIIENCAPCPDLCGSCDSDTQCGEDCKENAVNSNPGNDVCDCRDGYAPVTPDG